MDAKEDKIHNSDSLADDSVNLLKPEKNRQYVYFSLPALATENSTLGIEVEVPSCSMNDAFDATASSVIIDSDQVTVGVGPSSHTSGSSAITTKNITNYPWEQHWLPGSLVAVHCSKNYIAYSISSPVSGEDIVRTIRVNDGKRGIIKNIKGQILDIAFANVEEEVLLAFTTMSGVLYVFKVDCTDGVENLVTYLQLDVEIGERRDDESSSYHRVIWCQFIPDETEELQEEDYLLLATSGCQAEIFNMAILSQALDKGVMPKVSLGNSHGHQVVGGHLQPITDASFSPDGTALATASLDGVVRFFQVYMTDCTSSPRCLHQWSPHGGKPLSCLFFLDNHRNPSPDVQFWKFAVTGASNNSELRIWCCETWKCYQTINFMSLPSKAAVSPQQTLQPSSSNIYLKAAMDATSKYLVLSDIYRRVLYVLVIWQDLPSLGETSSVHSENREISQSSKSARVVSLSKLPVQLPTLYMVITDADWKPYKHWKHEQLPGFQEDIDEANGDSVDIVEGLVLRSYLISVKSLQEAVIRFQPRLPSKSVNGTLSEGKNTFSNEAALLNANLSEESVSLHDGLTDVSLVLSSSLSEAEMTSNLHHVVPQSEDGENITSVSQQLPCGPSIFHFVQPSTGSPRETSSTHKNSENVSVKSLHATAGITMTSSGSSASSSPLVTHVTPLLSSTVTTGLVPVGSSSSSPSLEIQQILNLEDKPMHTDLECEECPQSVKNVPDALDSSLLECGSSSTDMTAPVQEHISQVLDNLHNLLPSNLVPITPADLELPTSQTSESSMHEAISRATSVASRLPLYSFADALTHSQNHKTRSTTKDNAAIQALPSVLFSNEGRVTSLKPATSFLTNLQTVSSSKEKMTSPCETHRSPSSLSSLDVFVNLSNLSSGGQLTCEELEAEIKRADCTASSPFNLGVPALGSQTSESCKPQAERQHDVLVFEESTQTDYQEQLLPLDISQKNFEELMKEIMLLRSCIEDELQASAEERKTLGVQIDKLVKTASKITSHLEEMKSVNSKLPQNLSALLKSSIEPTVKSELKQLIPGAVSRSMESTRSQLKNEISSVVSGAESSISMSFTNLICSKMFIDSISGSVTSALNTCVQNACREAYNKVVLPGFSEISQQVFAQLNEAFQRGTKEYIQHIEGESHSSKASLFESLSKGTKALESASQSFSSQSSTVIELLKQNVTQNSSLSEGITDKLRKVIKEEVTRVLQEQQTNVEARASRTHTPTPSTPLVVANPKVIQHQLQTLIATGQVNSAFKQALSASDLSLVIFVCERVNAHQLFSQVPCPLTQDVLLSLISQLSVDLQTFTELKVKYLEDAIMNLDVNNSVTREHMGKVLQAFQRSASNYLLASPGNRKLKMLLMASNHLACS